jgi:hypothetical protein
MKQRIADSAAKQTCNATTEIWALPTTMHILTLGIHLPQRNPCPNAASHADATPT